MHGISKLYLYFYYVNDENVSDHKYKFICSIKITDKHNRVYLNKTQENKSGYINANYVDVSITFNSNMFFSLSNINIYCIDTVKTLV
jgi:hypothetical protein